MAIPAKQNLSITRGDTETIVVTMKNSAGVVIDITGRTYRAHIRTTKDAATTSGTFVCTVTNPTGGVVTFVMSAGSNAALTVGIQYWDFEENDAGTVATILSGTVNVLADVSR